MPSLVPHYFKNLLYATACQTLRCHATEWQLRYTGSHEVNEQFVKHFLIVQQERSSQELGPVASLPVTMPAQHHFLKDYYFHLLTFFQSVCPEVFHAVCLRLVFKEKSSDSAQTVQLLPRIRSKEKMFCTIWKKTQNNCQPFCSILIL